MKEVKGRKDTEEREKRKKEEGLKADSSAAVGCACCGFQHDLQGTNCLFDLGEELHL